MAGFRQMLSGDEEAWNPSAGWMTGKIINQVRGHNLCDLMLGASCSLEKVDWVQTEHRNPEETDEGLASASSKDASRSGVLTKSVRME